MSHVLYTFTQPVNPLRLEREIRGSSITIALDYITTKGNIVSVFFKEHISVEEEALLQSIITNHVPAADPSVSPPVDADGSPLVRSKATKTGWFYQVHSLGIRTATIGGIHNRRVHPVTGVESETGYATARYYDASGNLLTTQEEMVNCCQTQVDWSPDHDMEIRGGTVSQGSRPAGDCRLYVCIAPELQNAFFIQGGMNLKNMQVGNYAVDGETAKFLPAPTSPGGTVYGRPVNRFRIFLHHDAGLQHELLLTMQFYKP